MKSAKEDGYIYSSLPVGSKRSLGGEAGCGLADCLAGAILSDGNASPSILSIERERNSLIVVMRKRMKSPVRFE